MPVVKTVSPITEPDAPMDVPSKTVPSARIKNAFFIFLFIPFSGKKKSGHHIKETKGGLVRIKLP